MFVNVLGQDEIKLDDLIASITANETVQGINIARPTTTSSEKVCRISHSHTATRSNWCVFL